MSGERGSSECPVLGKAGPPPPQSCAEASRAVLVLGAVPLPRLRSEGRQPRVEGEGGGDKLRQVLRDRLCNQRYMPRGS